jgi:phage-related baseplate assembly protein
MTRFSATALDLSRVDPDLLWPARSFEAIRAARLEDLKTRLNAAGIPYDVDSLETDPGVYLQEASGYRELLAGQAIDDAQKKVLLAFAWGPWLDEIGRLHGVARQEGEDDSRFRARIQLAPEAFATTGTEGGYIFHAVSADVTVRDVGLTVLNRGTPDVLVEIVILSSVGDGAPSAELMEKVRARLYDPSIKLLTDTISVRPAAPVFYDVAATQQFRPGPDPSLIKSLGEAALRKRAEDYRRVGGDVPLNALSAALYVPNIDRVTLTAPAADIITLRWQVPVLRNVSLRTVIAND